MSLDYEELRTENGRRYGTEISRVGRLLLGERYADRTHFIFELLQNAEDALARRPPEWTGPRSVTFELMDDGLRVSHFGDPFNESDVRGICSIGEGTKDLTDIGRFGIGFKSVFAVTERPEVHSGPHAFAVDDYVLPDAVSPVERDADETVFLLPFKGDDQEAFENIGRGLRRLSAKTMLFLEQIEEIRWRVEEGSSGRYFRKSDDLDGWVRRVTVVEEERGTLAASDTWLIFDRSVKSDDGDHVGFAEIAFHTQQKDDSQGKTLRSVDHSPLIVYFPTVVETHLSFLVQGPFRTTPSRDNVPASAPWNRNLVRETGTLLVEALSWFSEHDCLDVETLRCLPLEAEKFEEAHEGMFAPVFTAVKQALSSEPLLPRVGGGQVTADAALLSRTGELRDLLNSRQLGSLFGEGKRRWWVTGEITRDRTPDLYQYLTKELEITEITPEKFVSRLEDKEFLEDQSDRWIRDLYHFLEGQSRLRYRFKSFPLIRLEDGSHVDASESGDPQAYLPGPAETEFPTVHDAVCDTATSRRFLQSLGLSEPDPVDDVLHHILPKYRDEETNPSDVEYKADIDRITGAYATDSKSRREALINTLRETPFVRAIDTKGKAAGYTQPSDLYIPTQRLSQLFSEVERVLFVDHSYDLLRGEEVEKLLRSAGAFRYIKPVECKRLNRLSKEERRRLRERAGKPETSGIKDQIRDWDLYGLDELLEILPDLAIEERRTRASLLWKELVHLEERRGKSVFEGIYSWSHYGDYRKSFDAGFVQRLNSTPWIPGEAGDLKRPDSIVFDNLEWEEHPFLQSKIRFRPPLRDQLAEKAGIDPGLIDLLKEIGVTRADEFLDRYGQVQDLVGDTDSELDPAGSGDGSRRKPGAPAESDDIEVETEVGKSEGGAPGPLTVADGTTRDGTTRTVEGRQKPATDERTGRRRFISYVAIAPEEAEDDPDGLDRQQRLALEEEALDLILSREPDWNRTPSGNPGFDLYQVDGEGQQSCWCEVKAMTGNLDDRPVGMSRTQFEHARRRGDSYWLYVVEHAGTDAARIIRIRDPAGKARTYTFDKGWREVADRNSESKSDA